MQKPKKIFVDICHTEANLDNVIGLFRFLFDNPVPGNLNTFTRSIDINSLKEHAISKSGPLILDQCILVFKT